MDVSRLFVTLSRIVPHRDSALKGDVMAKPPSKKTRYSDRKPDKKRWDSGGRSERNRGNSNGRRDTVTPTRWMPKGEACVESRPPMVIFGGIPGEAGKFRILDRGRNQTYAQWVYSQKPSPHRVSPPCEKYESCGG